MPAIIAHHLFGTEIQSRLGDDAFPTNDELSAFLLGNQGPDPYYYAVFTRHMVTAKKLGSLMHKTHVSRALDAMRELARTFTGDDQAIAEAYLKGYICHYAFDSVAHPFIYTWQYAIFDAGVEGLKNDSSTRLAVHTQIETDIDSAMLMRATGQTTATWRVHDHVLIASNHVLEVVDKLYRYTAAGVYGIVLPKGVFARSVKDFRLTAAVCHSPAGDWRDKMGRIERIFHAHSIAQAHTHRVDVGEYCDYDNVDHKPWTNPFTGEVSTTSFPDVYEHALDVAMQDLELFAEHRPSFDICGTTNFSGDTDTSDASRNAKNAA
jgi:hypothetical protein